MIERIKIDEFIASQKDFVDEKNESFLRNLSENVYGKFNESMYQHGLLLYLLVCRFRPKTILEIGTGGAYSSTFMMWALSTKNIDGKIFTIDRYSTTKPFKKNLTDEKIKFTTVDEQWQTFGPQNWRELIIPYTGNSGIVLTKQRFPKIDMLFIDGAHDYDSVKHDFFSCLEYLSDNFVILFDDYIDRPFYGVKKLIDGEISPKIPVQLIETNKILVDQEYKQHARCIITSNLLVNPITEIFPKKSYEKFLQKYRRDAIYVRKYREILNQKISFLKKIKFKWWKK